MVTRQKTGDPLRVHYKPKPCGMYKPEKNQPTSNKMSEVTCVSCLNLRSGKSQRTFHIEVWDEKEYGL